MINFVPVHTQFLPTRIHFSLAAVAGDYEKQQHS